MTNYFMRSAIGGVVTLIGVSFIVYLMTYISGDPAVLMLPIDATIEEIENLRNAMGFNDPFLVQYSRFISEAIRGDFGYSIHHREPALKLVIERLPATIELSLVAMTISICIGIPLGILAALHRQSLTDLAAMVMALIGLSMANFWLAIMLIHIFAVRLNLLPSFGRGGLKHLLLPAIALATRLIAIITRMTRATMIEVINEDYILTARAKGIKEKTILFRHALRNVLIPIVTLVALQLGALMGGTVIIETVFMWPGVGLLAVQAIYNRDYPLVQASVFVLALSFIGVNLLADLLYRVIDPRIDHQ